MEPTNHSPDQERPATPFGVRVFAVGGEIGCVTLIIVLAAVFGGLWLDRVLGTKPILTLILVLASAPLSLALTFWLAMRAVKNLNPPSLTGKTPGSSQVKTHDNDMIRKEETTGE